jgi:hypothetical protein
MQSSYQFSSSSDPGKQIERKRKHVTELTLAKYSDSDDSDEDISENKIRRINEAKV